MSVLNVPGARLYYETRGAGPSLLLIPGANGDARVFGPLAAALAERFTVITYDRRGFSRSILDGEQEYHRRLATDADDAYRLIRQHGSHAIVFGTSSGAVVALQLLLDHAEAVERVVPYEPSLMRLLPDEEFWLEFFGALYRTYREAGPLPALKEFRARTFAPGDREVMDRAGDPANGPHVVSNASYWFERELCQYTAVAFDHDRLRAVAEKVRPAVGEISTGFPTYEAGVVLGEILGRSVAQLPGGHVGFATDTDAFAAALCASLT